jgi:hypothetical protein
MQPSITTMKQSIDTDAIFRVRRAPRSYTCRFTVTFVGGSKPEVVGGGETLREAITFALNHMGAGDTLDVRATL